MKVCHELVLIGEHIIFFSLKQPFGQMEEQMDNFDFGLEEANVKNPKKTTDNFTKSIKWNQC